MKQPIETLLFDFGGTLDANGVSWKERFYAHYRAEGLDIAADAFESSFFAADEAGTGDGRSNGDRGVRIASRFLSEASAAFARNRPVLEALRERYQLGVV